jgi:hypothetical protein
VSRRSWPKTIFSPLVAVAAFLYFMLDAAFLSVIRPISRRLAGLPLFTAMARGIAALGPYATLALFLVPVIVLEPAKPLGFYLMASGHPLHGVAIIALGEVLKVTIVERIFHIGRPKLMTIQAFAGVYGFVMGWLDWLKALPPWQAVLRRYRLIALWVRSLVRRRRSARH